MIDSFLQDLEQQFGQLRRESAGAVMPMDGVRRDQDLLLRFDVPGIDPDSIEVTVERGVLSVSATRQESLGEDERLFVRERPMGVFTRRVYLPDHLDADAIEAAYNNGVLAVRIPVLEQAKPRKIEVVKETKAITG
ncbi:Hsp20/alpha crystallin family protein [Planobispora rosea]|nr:Hsp20/alpha crystallin family protein [Planobispora rosea]